MARSRAHSWWLALLYTGVAGCGRSAMDDASAALDLAMAEVVDLWRPDLAAVPDIAEPPDLAECHARPVAFARRVDSATVPYLSPTFFGAMGTADLTGDGVTDLVQVATRDQGKSYALLVLAGDGRGSLAAVSTAVLPGPDPGGAVPAIATGDFNRDGKVDVVWAGVTDDLRLALGFLAGDGRGGLLASRTSTGPVEVSGSVSQPLVVGDLDGDGWIDAIARHCNAWLTAWRNQRDGTFVATTIAQSWYGEPATADFTEDGHLDVAVRNSPDTADVELFVGDGAGHFSSTARVDPFNSYRGAIAAADFDGDRHVDLVSLRRTDGAVLLGDGQGHFTPRAIEIAAAGLGDHVAIADFNADGSPDFAVVDRQQGTVLVVRYRCAGKFEPPDEFAVAGAINNAPSSLLAADMNGDALPDLVIGRSDGVVTVLLNTTPR